MDHDDYVEINKHIDILKSNQYNLEHQANNQIIINERMIQRFNNISEHINNQQNILEEHINRFQNDIVDKLSNVEHMLKVSQYFDLLFFDIQTLNNHLEDIIESVTLAKLKIISKHILHPQEIEYIHEKLKQQNIDVKVDENVYEFLELSAYFNQSNIIFIVQIPTFYPESFSFYRLKQLPINNTYTLELKSQFLLLNKYFHQYVDQPCTKIEQTRYCSKTTILKNTPEGCVPNLINNKQAHCGMIEQTIEDTIEPIEQNYLFILTHTEIVIETTCNRDTQNKVLKGMALIYFENCTIKINNIQYSSKYATFWDSVQIISTLYNQINTSITTRNLTLEKLNLWTTKNTEAINLINLRNNNNHISIIGTIFLIISSIIGIIMIIQLIKRKRNMEPVPDSPATVTQPIQLSWPSLHS